MMDGVPTTYSRRILYVLVGMAGLILVLPACASHEQGASLGWTALDERTIRAEGQGAWRASAFGGASVGTVVCPGASRIAWGDGSLSAYACYNVTAIHPDTNVLVGDLVDPSGQPFTHSYAAPGSYTMAMESCCWPGPPLSQHQNNPGAANHASVLVAVGSLNQPPAAPFQAAFQCVRGTVCTLDLGTTDPDGDALVYSFADTEAGTGFTPPAGASIDPATGLFSWAAPPRTDPDDFAFWSVAVVVEDATSSTVSQFIVGGPFPPCGAGVPRVLHLQATASRDVDLAWRPPGCAVTSYTVQRAAHPGGPYATIAGLPGNATTYTDPTGRCYDHTYRVLATTAVGTANDGARLTVRASRGQGPSTPTALAATLHLDPFAHGLAWQASRSHPCPVLEYRVHRTDLATGNTVRVASVPGTSYRDGTARPCIDYLYEVTAHSAAGPSAGASIMVRPPVTKPLAPASLAARGHNTGAIVSFTPGDNACPVTHHEVLRDGAVVGSVAHASGTLLFQDPGPLTPCQVYVYEMRSLNGAGTGPGRAVPYTHPVLAPSFITVRADCPT